MLCCVSRRTVSGADQGSLYDHYLTKVQPVESGKVVELEKSSEPDVPPILQPCAICARTFKPQSLEKHTKICEQTACKKRKPFDSAKQRIQGTELAEFLPRQERRRHTQDDRSGGLKSSWKQTHDDFLRQIRAARNENVDDTMQKPGTTHLSSSAPMRANEQGVCPTCNRHFGVKAYDRHVAWCKDRIARVQTSPATNIAKERLEARMKYRAPSLKNRRQITREKYSPTSATNLHSSSKTSPTPHTSRAKGSASAPNCNKGNDSPVKQKAAAVRRAGQSKGGSSPIGPMKSRPIDRSNRLPEDGSGPVTFPPAPLNKRTLLPVPPLKYKKQSLEEYNIISSPKRKLQTRIMAKQLPNYRAKLEDTSQLSGRSMRSSIVSGRSEGHPKLNDLSINVDVTGMTVKPCDLHPKNSLTTWKKISQAKVQSEHNIERVPSCKSNREAGHFSLNQHCQEKEPTADSSIASKPSSSSGGHVNWQSVTPRLNRTYSFKDSSEDINDALSRNQRRKRVKNSPRIEFCFGDLEKLERLRQSHCQRNVEDEKEASRIPKDSLEDLSCEKDWKNSRKLARSQMLERRRLNLSCDQLANQNEERRPDSSKIVYPRNNTLCDNIGVALREERFPQELPSPIVGEQFKLPEEFHELGERRKDDSLSGRLSRGEYRPRTTDILKVKEDNDVNFELPLPIVGEQFKLPEEFHELEERGRDDSLSGRLSRGEYRPRTTDILKVKEDNDVNFELPSPIVGEQFKLPEEFHELEERGRDDSLSGKLSKAKYRPRATDVLKVREDNDVNFELPSPIVGEQFKVTEEFHELEERGRDDSLSGRLSKAKYRPRTTDILKVREDNDVNFELPSPIVGEQFKVTEEFHELEERGRDDSLSGRLSKAKYRPRTTDILKVREDNDVNFELPSPIVGEQFKVTEEFHELGERRKDDLLSGRLARGKYRPRATDVLKVREDNDVNFATDELDPPAKYNDDITKFCYIETSLTEMEPESVLMKDVLRPSRSSTPFDKSTNWKEREQSMTPPPNKWEMAVNEETGSELLYRVEVEEENLSGRNDIDESGVNDISNSDCLTTTHCTDNKPIAAEKEEIQVSIGNRKDIASQAAICKCSPRVIDVTDERSIDDDHSPSDESIEKPEKIKEENPGYDYKEDDIDPDDLSTFPNSILETIKIADEEVHEIYKNFSSKDFDCPSDDSIDEMPEPRSGYERSVENDSIDVRDLRSMILSESHVTVKKSANAAFKSRYSKVIGIENRILEHVNETNDSNDSLSMIDGVDLTGVKQVETVEVETIEEIGTGSRNVRFGVLPDIKRTTIVVKKDRNKSETITTQTYWKKAPNTSKDRLINLDLPYQESSRLLKRNPKVLALPPVSSRSFLTKRSGKDYNPFLLAEQQMNDLLSDASEQSVTDSPLLDQNRETSFPLSHSSAFVKYPYQTSPSNTGKRSSLIAPPTEFDDLVSEFSSDSTETNSLCREVYLKDDKESKSNFEKKSPARELGRRVIIDKSKALGGDVTEDNDRGSRSFVGNSDRARKILDKVSPKVIRPTVNRSFSVRASSAPKTTLDKKNSSNDAKKSSGQNNDPQRPSNASLNNRNNNYVNLSTSNLSLSSIVSSDVDIKRSNSVFDELMTSFDDENSSFASLKSLLKSDSLSVSSPVHGRQRNDQNSDEELSSPESYKRQDHGKFSGDSAYSSLNRKYSHHGRSTNDVAGRLDEDYTRQNRGRSDGEGILSSSKCKMSKFCHECGSKFPETAKFCCECGIRRLVL